MSSELLQEFSCPAETREKLVERISKLRNLTRDEKQDLYKVWAPSYDKDVELLQRTSPRLGVETLHSYLKDLDNPLILDLAAGTGLVGQELLTLGYHRIDALDCCQPMLDIAKEKNIYRKIINTEFGSHETEGITEGSYDGLICIGSFEKNNLFGDCLPEVLRIIKTGGVAVIVLRGQITELEEPMEELEKNYRCRVKKNLFQNYMQGHDDGKAYIIEKL